MRLILRRATAASALLVAVWAFPGCSSGEGDGAKMDGGAMPSGKMDGDIDKGKMGGGAMDSGKMDGAMPSGKMDGAMDKGKMEGTPK
jgi:hypothetical protein